MVFNSETLELLSKDVKYYENPIDKPCSNFDEVVKLWEVVEENQKDIDYKFNIVCRKNLKVKN